MGKHCALGIVFAGLVLGLTGCGNARLVTVERNGGVVAIPDNSNAWPSYYRDKATALMRDKCPQGYVIDREEEVVVGTTVNTNTRTESTPPPTVSLGGVVAIAQGPGQDRTETATSYHDQTEWRIWFHGK
jgi:hypothetical protein